MSISGFIGPVGTGLRALVGVVLVYIAAGASWLEWKGECYDTVGGLLAD